MTSSHSFEFFFSLVKINLHSYKCFFYFVESILFPLISAPLKQMLIHLWEGAWDTLHSC